MHTYFGSTLFILGCSVLVVACDSTSTHEPSPTPTPSAKHAVEQDELGSRALSEGQLLPTGARITPDATPGAVFQGMNPDLSALPDQLVDHAVTTALSPNGKTLLILTSGYNAVTKPDNSGDFIPELSSEYVFVFDVT